MQRRIQIWCLIVLIVSGLTAGSTLLYRDAIRGLRNNDILSIIAVAADHVYAKKNNIRMDDIILQLKNERSDIRMANGFVLDSYGRCIQIELTERALGYELKASSSGRDGVFGTSDDQVLEGLITKEW